MYNIYRNFKQLKNKQLKIWKCYQDISELGSVDQCTKIRLDKIELENLQ